MKLDELEKVTGKANQDEINKPGQNVLRFYRWHAHIYDLTRWTFLFGRSALLNMLPIMPGQKTVLVEVGCGTGRNLRRLAKKHPMLYLHGVDMSRDMLDKAHRAISRYTRRAFLHGMAYGSAATPPYEAPDIVLFSYSLTMFNPGWEAAIEQAYQELKPGGWIAVVDFHDTPFTVFRRWMGFNHVRMDGHLAPYLKNRFEPAICEVRTAWFGLWRYVKFIGRKKSADFQTD
ncbi:MAG: class I SAM-dependent methyltransferase [Saprospiraceae bacterium]